jgi:lipopolysaccharide/colanic/teichoic acid biosynthesis glycosyltransferase
MTTMRLRAPTSKTQHRAKLAPFDVLWAIAAPFLALALRDPIILEQSDGFGDFGPAYQYAFTTMFFAFVSFLVFRISDSMSHLFSVNDVLAICGAVMTTVASSSLTLFVLTRMDGVPRSTPLIYALVLGAGLTVARTMAKVSNVGAGANEETDETQSLLPQHLRRVLLIGADRFAAATIKLVDCQRPRTTLVVAALDPRMHFHGRVISGVKIVGRVEELEEIVDEYQVHGVEIDEVWLSDDAAALPAEALQRLSEQCEARGLKLKRIAVALNLEPRVQEEPRPVVASAPTAEIDLPEYFRLKRVLDILASAGLLIALMPLATIAACFVLYDVGAPILFWQQRIGRNGRKFLLYKFRTYHAPFDRRGNKIAQEDRLSGLGRAIRAGRLDEIPQLLNVLVGDMSLIGPRPLLPIDQPSDPRLRLSVRPGITGWAQLNGGTFVTPTEKDALDVWYITHASLALDLKIAIKTLLFSVTGGEKMNHAAVEEAVRWRATLHPEIEAPADDLPDRKLRPAAE